MKKTRVEKFRAIVPLIFNYYLLKKKPVDGRLVRYPGRLIVSGSIRSIKMYGWG